MGDQEVPLRGSSAWLSCQGPEQDTWEGRDREGMEMDWQWWRPGCKSGIAVRAPDKFKLFKPCLKKIHILADNLWLENAQIYKNVSVSVCLCLSVCMSVYLSFNLCNCLMQEKNIEEKKYFNAGIYVFILFLNIGHKSH